MVDQPVIGGDDRGIAMGKSGESTTETFAERGQRRRDEADRYAGRICAAATSSAQASCLMLELIGEFDETGLMDQFEGLKSMAHWLSWRCSMTPGVAREHVRVARTMRQMPTVTEAFREGQLSYSKVREISRVVGRIDEQRLCRLAKVATASQLARMISAYRRAAGERIEVEARRGLTVVERPDGLVEFKVRLPPEEAALVLAALEAGVQQFGDPPPKPGDPAPPAPKVGERRYNRADALLDLSQHFLAAAPADRSGEDRTVVMVQVSAETLALAGPTEPPGGWLANDGRDAVATIEGVGAIEAETARKLACDPAELLGAVIDAQGDVLTLGRSRRLVSKKQRRALMVRDRICQFPGCHQTRHLKAHHRVHWANGGPTDLDNLILLCQYHHTYVHEGGMTIDRADGPYLGGAGAKPWVFRLPDGMEYGDHCTDSDLGWRVRAQLRERRDRLAAVTSLQDPAARPILPGWTGEPFSLHDCVYALFGMRLPHADAPGEAAASASSQAGRLESAA